jgi:hypothetical protein
MTRQERFQEQCRNVESFASALESGIRKWNDYLKSQVVKGAKDIQQSEWEKQVGFKAAN